MTVVLVTVDTELSALLHQRGESAARNFALSITGETDRGRFGIGWQMDVLERHGLKGVYFTDPMPGLVYGEAIVADMVGPILARGHEVQLHIHTEWLEWAKDAPVAARGQNIGDFSFDDQLTLLGWARDALVRAGVPSPTAFRAGNYGANDETLRALAHLGLRWDSSFNGAYAGGLCCITLDPEIVDPVAHQGLIEVPVAAIHDRPGQLRSAQVCALSSSEMRAALGHAAATARPAFSIVTHSFEMLSRDRMRPNRAVMARFEAMCAQIAGNPGLEGSGFAALDGAAMLQPATVLPSRLGPNRWRTLARMGEQALATWAYERQLFPA